ERSRVMDRLSRLQHQQLEQAQYDALGQPLHEFCREMNDVLDHPSFETKQRILRLVVDKILVRDEEITIQHTVPISDVRLCRDHYTCQNRSQVTLQLNKHVKTMGWKLLILGEKTLYHDGFKN